MTLRSPHKLSGIPATARRTAKRAPQPREFSLSKDQRTSLALNHKFCEQRGVGASRVSPRAIASNVRTCQRCGQPQFAVEGLPCRGGRKR